MAPTLSSLTVSGNALILDFNRDIDLNFLTDRFETAQIRGRFFLQISGLRRDLVSLSATRERPRRLTLNFTGAAARSDQSCSSIMATLRLLQTTRLVCCKICWAVTYGIFHVMPTHLNRQPMFSVSPQATATYCSLALPRSAQVMPLAIPSG